MRAKGLAAVAIAAVAAIGLTGCGSSDEVEATASTRTVQTPAGPVEVPTDPQRIVACGYATLPLIQAGANLAAVCEWTRELDGMDAETRTAYDALPKVAPDGSVADLDFEAVTAADPDLIILGVPARVREQLDMAKLEAIAPVVFNGPTTPAQWRTLGAEYADAAGVADSYGEFTDEYDARAAEIAAKYEATLGGLTFGGVCDTCQSDAGQFFREYTSSYTTNLFDDLGLNFPGQPVNPEDEHGEYLSLEQLPESLGGVDVIVYGVQADGTLTAEMQALVDSPLWQALPAVKAGNVVAVKFGNSATHRTALLALDSIDEGLAALPANKG